jgi:hypothetical protein
MTEVLMKVLFLLLLAAVVTLLAIFGRESPYWTQAGIREHCGKPGIPLKWHGGFWMSITLLPLTLGVDIIRYADVWTLSSIMLMAGLGVLVALGNHLLLIFTQEIPDPLAWIGEKWNRLVAAQFAFMTVAVMFIGLICNTPGVSYDAVAWLSLLLGFHVMAGMQIIPMGYWVRTGAPQGEGVPDPFDSFAWPWMQIVIWIFLGFVAARAGDQLLGILIGIFGVLLVLAIFVIEWIQKRAA